MNEFGNKCKVPPERKPHAHGRKHDTAIFILGFITFIVAVGLLIGMILTLGEAYQ